VRIRPPFDTAAIGATVRGRSGDGYAARAQAKVAPGTPGVALGSERNPTPARFLGRVYFRCSLKTEQRKAKSQCGYGACACHIKSQCTEHGQ
jgi:hypothetical protein